MELGSQERKRENQTLYNFTIKSAPNTIETAYTLINQKWLVPEHNPKKQEDTVDGTGPLRLVRNKMTYAAFYSPRIYHTPNEQEVIQNGLILFNGGFSTTVIVPDWLSAKPFKAFLNDPHKHFIEKELKIQQNASALDFAPFLSSPEEGKQP